VEQWTLDTPSTKINTFSSSIEAERQTGIRNQRISGCTRGEEKTAGGFRWKYKELESQKDLKGEEWKSNFNLVMALCEKNPNKKVKNFKKVRVSNLGRIQTTKGIITRGTKEGQNGYYRIYARWRVHQLVWMMFGTGKVPKKGDKLMILHNDEIEQDEEGCVSNAISNLRLDTQSENQKSYNRAKAKKRMISETSDDNESNKRARI